jgi:transposase
MVSLAFHFIQMLPDRCGDDVLLGRVVHGREHLEPPYQAAREPERLEMTQEDLDGYLEYAVQSLADELKHANAWSAEESLTAANQSFDTALPGRVVGSKNQFLRTIVADGQKVGVLWYGLRSKQEAFVWDILIYRKRGRLAVSTLVGSVCTLLWAGGYAVRGVYVDGRVGSGAGRKKAHTFRSVEQKRRIVEETLKAGVSVSSVGRAHGINANQVFQWRKLYRPGLLNSASGPERMRLLPVAVSEEAESGTVAAPGATTIECPISGSSTGTIELSLGWGQLRIAGAVDGETLRTVLGCLLT